MATLNIPARGYGPQSSIRNIVTRGYVFPPGSVEIVDTDIVQKPVDFYMPGLPQYRDRYRTFEYRHKPTRQDVRVKRGDAQRLSGEASYTVRTDKKGYS